MNKLVLLFALVVVVVAEPPSNYGAPQQYSAPHYSSGGYSDDGGDGSDYVDDELLARVAQLWNTDSGHSSSSYGAPSSGYGAPSRSSGIILGRPERAHRVAEFDLETQRSHGGYSNGGYSQGGYN